MSGALRKLQGDVRTWNAPCPLPSMSAAERPSRTAGLPNCRTPELPRGNTNNPRASRIGARGVKPADRGLYEGFPPVLGRPARVGLSPRGPKIGPLGGHGMDLPNGWWMADCELEMGNCELPVDTGMTPGVGMGWTPPSPAAPGQGDAAMTGGVPRGTPRTFSDGIADRTRFKSPGSQRGRSSGSGPSPCPLPQGEGFEMSSPASLPVP